MDNIVTTLHANVKVMWHQDCWKESCAPCPHTRSSGGFGNSVDGCVGPASECVRQVCCSACEVGSAEFTAGVQLSHHGSSTSSLYTCTETREQVKKVKGK